MFGDKVRVVARAGGYRSKRGPDRIPIFKLNPRSVPRANIVREKLLAGFHLSLRVRMDRKELFEQLFGRSIVSVSRAARQPRRRGFTIARPRLYAPGCWMRHSRRASSEPRSTKTIRSSLISFPFQTDAENRIFHLPTLSSKYFRETLRVSVRKSSPMENLLRASAFNSAFHPFRIQLHANYCCSPSY